MSHTRRQAGRKAQKRTHDLAREPVCSVRANAAEEPGSGVGILVGLVLLVMAIVLVVHWPALSAQALSFDDTQYVVDNPLVRHPSWASAKRFFTEVLKPSTVDDYPYTLPRPETQTQR